MVDNIPNKDERTVAAIRNAGAIVVGKTNTPEFGAGANTTNPVYGPTRNPFDPARICGGSSGGSAVALATSMVPICSGSDTGGSLRIPAAFCGIVIPAFARRRAQRAPALGLDAAVGARADGPRCRRYRASDERDGGL